MKKIGKTLLLVVLAMMLALPALAEDITFDGQVTAAYAQDVYASFTGTIDRVNVLPGDPVEADTPVARLRTTKVYAEVSGTVVAVPAQVGDSVEAVTTRYGAPMYIDDGVRYTVSASCDSGKAYASVETRRVQPGETVYLRSRSDDDHTGVGLITAVNGSSYTVEVAEGAFLSGESVNVYRDAAFTEKQRIGRGSIANKAPEAVTAAGRVVSLAVQAGDTVQRGDLLMETLEGGMNGGSMSSQLLSGVRGVVAEVLVAQGDSVTEGARIASIWPAEAMQIEALIPESDLAAVAVGDAVSITFDWNQDDAQPMQGTVTGIAYAADSESTSTCYTATIAFTPDDTVRYGMNVTIAPAN